MSRCIVLTLALVALAPLSPLGCPPTEVPQDLLPLERGTLSVTVDGSPSPANYGDTVRLRASVASASGAVRFSWLQTAGTGTAIDAADQDTASFQAPSLQADQTLTFLATARDDSGAVGRAAVSVTVSADPDFGLHGNTGPTRANAGLDQSVPPGTQVTLDGSNSTGVSLNYAWRQVSGPTVTFVPANAAIAKFTAPAFTSGNNVLLFELTVTDSSGHVMTDRVQVTVLDPNATNPQVTVSTTMGDFVVELDPNKAPNTARNYLRYVDDQFYDNLIFHRVIKDFVIQGGGYSASLVKKEGRPPIALENTGLHNNRGTIAMARTNDPNSATCEFFINLKNNIAGGDGTTNLDPGGVSAEGYTVFGKVVSGMSVVDSIGGVATHSTNGFDDVPVTTVTIKTIRRIQQSNSSGTTTSVSQTGTGDVLQKFP